MLFTFISKRIVGNNLNKIFDGEVGMQTDNDRRTNGPVAYEAGRNIDALRSGNYRGHQYSHNRDLLLLIGSV